MEPCRTMRTKRFNFESGSKSEPVNPLRALFMWLAQLPPVVMLMLILACSVIVTCFYMNLRETAKSAVTQFAPSAHLMNPLSIFVIALLLIAPFEILQQSKAMTWRSKRRKTLPEDAKLQFLNTPTTLEVPVACPNAWVAIKSNLQEEIIKGCETRRTHWEIVGLNESRKQLRLSLRYTNDALGRRPYQLSARNLTCSMRVTSLGGHKTQVELSFGSKFPMDYRTVRELIDQTKKAIRRIAIQPEPEESADHFV